MYVRMYVCLYEKRHSKVGNTVYWKYKCENAKDANYNGHNPTPELRA